VQRYGLYFKLPNNFAK